MKKVDILEESMGILLKLMDEADDRRNTKAYKLYEGGLDALIEERNRLMDAIGASRGYEGWNDYCYRAYEVSIELFAEGTSRRGFRY